MSAASLTARSRSAAWITSRSRSATLVAAAGSGMLLRVSHCLRVSFAMRWQVAAVAFPHLPQVLAATGDFIAPIAVSVEVPNPMPVGVDRPYKGVAADEHDIRRRGAYDKGIGGSGHIFFHDGLLDVDWLRRNDDRRGDDHCRRADDDLGPANVDLSFGRQCEAGQGGRHQGAA